MLRRISCVLIDDDVDDYYLFRDALTDWRTQVSLFYFDSPVEALKVIDRAWGWEPDFIFIDMNMPALDGLECLGRFRKKSRTADTRIFLYSTNIDEVTRTRAEKLGANGCIVKPDSRILLRNTLASVLNFE